MQMACDFDGIKNVAQCVCADFLRGIAERTEFVLLILKEIGIDGAGADSGGALERLNLFHICEAAGEIPQNVKGECGGGTGEAMHFGGIVEFFF